MVHCADVKPRELCLRHPEVKDVCDLGQILFWNWRPAWWLTGIMFILNNTFIQGLHCLVGAQYLSTMTGGAMCSVGFAAIMMLISWICSLPRTFSSLSRLATVSAFFTFISVILAAIFAAIEDHPGGATEATYWPKMGHVKIYLFPPPGTSFVAAM